MLSQCVNCVATGNGKSHYIRKQLKAAEHSAVLVINEAFHLSHAIDVLEAADHGQEEVSLHLNITTAAPLKASADLIAHPSVPLQKFS